MFKLVQKLISKNGNEGKVCKGLQTKVNAKLMTGSSLLLSLLCFAPSCSNDSEDTDESFKGEVSNGGTFRLGKKIANPYSLKTVQQAYNELAEKTGVSSETIEPTHLYLKFAPKNKEEVKLLEADTTLFFYNYPLDVELIGEGGGYHDPSLPEDVPTYQYVCAPINHPLPEVAYEVLDEVYYEDENTSSLRSGKAISWEDLEEKAYLIAGDSSIIATPETRSSQWRASGYLYYYDTYTGKTTPLVGVPVRMRYHIITYQNCTNASGYFQSPEKKRGDCKYSIEWKRDPFRIRPNSGIATADYVIQENTKSVNKTFYPSENIYQWYYATIFKGAHEYFYGDIYGLPRPENNMEIRASNSSGSNVQGTQYVGGSDEVEIFRNDRKSNAIIETVFHELTHSAHYNATSISKYTDTDKKIKDSWSCCVAYFMSVRMYGDNSRSFYTTNNYTGLMIDLIDTDPTYVNQYYGQENVSGYTILQVWNVVKNSKTISSFKTNLKNYYDNSTEKYLDNLFSYWGW